MRYGSPEVKGRLTTGGSDGAGAAGAPASLSVGSSAGGEALARARLPMLAVILLGTLAGMKTADASIASITLVNVSEAFHLSASLQAFAASIGTLALAASALPLGALSDRIGRRRVLTLSLLTMLAGALLATVAPGALVFIIARAVTGVGLGGVFGCAFAMVAAVAPGSLTPRALGIWNATIMPAALVMQLLGSVLAEIDWRLAYLTLPILALPLLFASRAELPETARESRRGNPAALIAIATAILVFLTGISMLANSPGAAGAWACIAAGLALFVVWVVLEKRSSHPTFPVSLLRKPIFIAAVIAGMLFNVALGLLTLQLANFWEYLRGYEAVQVTVGLLPVTVVAALTSLAAGRWLAHGAKASWLMPFGLAVCAAGFFTLLPATAHSPYLVFLPALVLVPTGISFVTVPQSQVFVAQAPPGFTGAVTSSRITFGQLGYSVGIALSVALISIGANMDFPHLLRDAGVNPVRAGTVLADVQMYASLHDGKDVPAARAVVQASASAYTAGFRLVMLVFAGACLAGALVIVLLAVVGRRRGP